MKRLIVLTALLAPTASAATPTLAATEPLVSVHTNTIKSKVLNEDRPYSVYLPPSYHHTRYAPADYAVLYLLDGETFLQTAVALVDHMSNTSKTGNMQIPELIVVAIPNTERGRDMIHAPEFPDETNSPNDTTPPQKTPEPSGADRFLEFIETELIPQIDRDYRTLPHRTIVGHSLSALAALHSLLTQPGLFQNYIAIDPSLHWANEEIIARLPAFFADHPDVRARVAVTAVNYEQRLATYKKRGLAALDLVSLITREGVRPFENFQQALDRGKPPHLHVAMRKFPEETHDTVPLPSLYYGLKTVFKGYEPDMLTVFDAPADELERHFAAYSELAGAQFLPPEPVIDAIGNEPASQIDVIVEEGDEDAEPFYEASEAYYRLNVRLYPESDHARTKLADYLRRKDARENNNP